MEMVRWMAPAVLSALLVLVLVYVSDKKKEPAWLVLSTFAFGAVGAVASHLVEEKAAAWTGLDMRVQLAGNAGALLFMFGFVAPMREAVKTIAMWPAFRSKHFDEAYDGVVYASAAAIGFAAVENAMLLRDNPVGKIWYLRALIALPAHLFFACAWGYALGRAKRLKHPGALFPAAWTLATVAHGFYAHLVYGRGPGALVAVIPLLLAMGILALVGARDLQTRETPVSSIRPTRLSKIPGAPTLAEVREALRKEGRPLAFEWVLFGVLVTIGAMIVGLGASIALGFWAHVDFSAVNEKDMSTTAPVALLGSGILAAFPMSGYLIAKASNLQSLLEPALAVGLALVVVLLMLGLAAPIALLFALAFSPVAWGLACAGAWVGRPTPAR